MVAHKNQAWVTAVLNDGDANKATVLAGSLRRVLTTKKCVAVFTPNVSEDARDLLRDKFDLAVLIDEKLPDGVNPEDFAKIFAFSFNVFNKCAYLSASTMVLRNCDELFDNYKSFAALKDDDGIDTSVFVFTPSTRHYKAMRKIVGNGHLWKGSATQKEGHFSKYFGKWLLNQEPSTFSLDARYNQKISLLDEMEVYDGLQSDLVVVNFVTVHPIEVADKIISSSITTLGIVESFLCDKCLTIHMEEVRTRSCLQAEETVPEDESENVGKDNEPIAIIGMACRYPSANNVDQFWKLLAEGREGIKPLPTNRWTKSNSILTPTTRDVHAGFLDVPIDEFDSKFFGISTREAVFVDPQQRLLHEVVWECLEDANIDPHSLRDTQTGIFVGSWIHDYKDIVVRSPDVDFFRVYMGNSIAAGAARLSYFLGVTGPSIATESGCSSAIVGVDMALHSLRNRNCSLAVASGVNLTIHPFDQSMLSFVVAPDGRCKTFDAKANGFGRAEGCGVLLMKRLSDAVKDGDKIWGLIRGSAVTQEGVSKSLGTPTVQCEALAMELALKDAEVEPKDVSFVETHGTGTPVGDPMEIAAIGKVYSKGRKDPLWIGSVKTNIGHTESVSGITGIIKVILAMKNEIIPRHLNFETLNPDINLDVIHAEIPLTEIAWPRTHGKPRIAGVSSFGISGTDGHIIVQEAPDVGASSSQMFSKCERPLHIMKVSAKCPESLDALLKKYREAFTENSENIDFADFAYSANVGRSTFNHRAVIIAKDTKEAMKIIEQNSLPRKEVQPSGGKLCFLFTGQGSQYPGMAAELYKSSPVFRMSFDKCNLLLQKMHGISIKDTLWNSKNSEELSRTLYSQTSIFCIEYCLLRLWESWGVKPDYVMGHSLGEFAAAVAAGILDLKGALTLVAERSRLIDALPRGKMIVVKADKTAVNKILDEFTSSNKGAWLDYAAVNSFDQTVLAGNTETINDFAQFCEAKNLKTIILAATHAFHSRHMDPMLNAYKTVASKVKPGNYQNVSCEYISGMEGKLMEKEDLLQPEYWARHTREKVNFIEACRTAYSEGCTYFLEVGPHPVLSALAMANIDGPGINFFSSLRRKQDDWATILESLGKLYLSEWNGSINWKGFDEYFPRRKVPLPFYPFNRKKIWAQIKPVQPKLHPLLGSSMENASSITVFENDLTIKQAPYLGDHVIGSSVVFPGAGFLEMLLAGGYSHVQCLTDEFTLPRRPITLKNMKIDSPLGMEDSKATTMQVLVELFEETTEGGSSDMGYKTKVFHWHKADDDDTGHWVSHASATFMPIVTDDSLLNMDQVNVKEIQEQWTKSQISSDLYKKLPDAGLRFGSTFQSLEGGWRKKQEPDEKEKLNGGGPKGPDNDDAILISVKVPQEIAKYIAHPVLVDAMIQAAMLWSSSKERLHRRLYVPVSVQEFTWLRGTESTSRFVYCAKDDKDKIRVTMVDEDGLPLMSMAGIDFVETSASVVESMINQQSSQTPAIWEEIWRHRPGPLETQMVFGDNEEDTAIFSNDELERAYELNELDTEEYDVYRHLDAMTVVHFLNTLYELGWNPNVGVRFTLQELMSQLEIVDTFRNFTNFFLKCLSNEGLLGRDEPNVFVVDKPLPAKSELSEKLRHTVTDTEASRPDFKTIYEVGGSLKEILLGRLPPLSILFPEGPGMQLVDAMYDQIHGIVTKSSAILLKAIISRYTREVAEVQNKAGMLRVLEVGAGTGFQTGLFLGVLETTGIPYEYYYTDISAAFFNKAEEKFAKYKSHLKFKKFNIEEDPLAQDFSPGYFDMVVAAEVIHATRNIREAISNLRLVMRDRGSIKIVETTDQDRRLSFIFGLLEGYWRFRDYDLRPDHPTLSPETWENVLNSTGFEFSVAIPCFSSVHSTIFGVSRRNYYPNGMYKRISAIETTSKPIWLIFGNDTALGHTLSKRLTSLDREVIYLTRSEYLEKVVDKAFIEGIVGSYEDNKKLDRRVDGIIYMWGAVEEGEHDQAKLAKPFLYLCQFLWDNQKMGPKMFVITRGTFSVDESKYLNPSPTTVVAMSKVFRAETSLPVKCIDLPSNKSLEEQVEQVFGELWYHEDCEDMIAYRGDKRLCPRLAAFKTANESLSLPKGSDRFQLILPKTRMIADLQFGFLNHNTLGEHDIEVRVKATALNFRDVFAVIKPDPQFDKINAVGLDYAGIVSGIGTQVTKWKVGDAVFGANLGMDLALPSHIKIGEDHVIAIPVDSTFAQAATLPAVFSTAFYCLVTIAKIKSEDTILIHTASGGVGICAIQIAQHFGATIVATAGSERKRAYLRNLGIQHVFHSRDTNYGDEILKATNGKGVDIVLNSLTGPGFKEATLKCCAKGARFIEMSKLTIWQPEEVKAFRPDVDYTIVDLTTLDKKHWQKLFSHMHDFVKEGVCKPVPYVRFDAVNIRAALNHLQKAKHIGKIICIMPETKMKNGKLTSVTPLFNDRSTYIITGAVTGGIGLETARFMLAQGAKYLVLVGRSKPHEKAQELLNLWNANGHKVEAWLADVGNYEQCKALIERIKCPANGYPPIRGIMHAAGALSDGTLPNQTWEKFEHTYNAKVNGSWNLHRLTLDCQLEHFVFFSSMAALVGTPGQANHSSANSFEDSFAHYRNSIGLTATTINWGPWGQVGVATDIDIPGFRPLSTLQGIMGIDYILRSTRVHAGVWNVDSYSLLAKFIPGIKHYIDDPRLFAETKGPVFNLNSDEFWSDVDEVEEREEKEEVFRKYIKVMVRTVLKLDPEEAIDDHEEFQALGVDSLMMLEMKNNLQNLFGNRMTVTASDLKGCNTTDLLAAKLVDILLSTSAAEEVPLSLEELRLLVIEDSKLPKEIVPAPQGIKCPSQIKTVLVTGGTGMLAPYIIQLISKMPQISRIVCLIRKRGKVDPDKRFSSVLESNGLLQHTLLEKIECIEGDVGQPQLGLTKELYDNLAATVDCVIHCAAKVDHLQTYRRTAPQEKFHTRTSNVFGTKHVLEFAASQRTKIVYHAGTFAMIYSQDKTKGGLSEDWEAIEELERIPMNSGYTISKYVAEQLVKQAVERGIPCKSFRLPFLSGDSKTGWHDIRGNHTMLRYLTYMKVGALPLMPMPILTLPVDYCAEITVKLFFDEGTPFEVYNVVPPKPELEQEFPRIAKEFGYDVDVVEYSEFLDRINQIGESSPIHAFMEIYQNEENITKISTCPAIPSVEKWISQEQDTYFQSEKLQKYCPDLYSKMESPLEAVRRDLQYLKDTGIFEKFGL